MQGGDAPRRSHLHAEPAGGGPLLCLGDGESAASLACTANHQPPLPLFLALHLALISSPRSPDGLSWGPFWCTRCTPSGCSAGMNGMRGVDPASRGRSCRTCCYRGAEGRGISHKKGWVSLEEGNTPFVLSHTAPSTRVQPVGGAPQWASLDVVEPLMTAQSDRSSGKQGGGAPRPPLLDAKTYQQVCGGGRQTHWSAAPLLCPATCAPSFPLLSPTFCLNHIYRHRSPPSSLLPPARPCGLTSHRTSPSSPTSGHQGAPRNPGRTARVSSWRWAVWQGVTGLGLTV